MNFKIILIAILTIFFLTSCEQLPGEINEAKREVRRNLIDPDSAKFGEAIFNKKTEAVCGFVNAKNRMGGYTGFNPFVYEKSKGVTLVQEPPTEKDFERYFELRRYSEIDEYYELEAKCTSVALWKEKCESEIYLDGNKYCRLINAGKSYSEVYDAAEPNLDVR